MKISLCTSTQWSPGTQQLLSAFRQDHANKLLKQTQRLTYGSAASALRRGGGVKIFCQEGEPQQRLKTRPLQRTSNSLFEHGIYLRCPPFLPYGIQLHYTAPTQHGNRTNRIHPGKPVMSLSFPILPGSLDLPAQHFVFLYIFSWGCIQGTQVGALGQDTQFLLHRPTIPLGWKLCCKQEDCRCIHAHRVFKWEQGQAHKTLRQFHGNL